MGSLTYIRSVDRKQTAKNLENLMKRFDIKSMNALATACGISSGCVRLWVLGKSSMSFEHAMKIADLFNVEIDEVIAFKSADPEKPSEATKPVDMTKRKITCGICRYGCKMVGFGIVCDYQKITGSRRPCKGPLHSADGECACFSPAESRRKRPV